MNELLIESQYIYTIIANIKTINNEARVRLRLALIKGSIINSGENNSMNIKALNIYLTKV